MMKLFIYGSLKEGFWNHNVLEEVQAVKIADVKTKEKLPLFDLSHSFPYLQNTKDMGYTVKGELYEVHDHKVPLIDDFEGVPDLYKREKVSIDGYEDVYTYFIADELSKEKLDFMYFLDEFTDI